ncbi:Presenilin [Meloidogyne graminicola]|uniref:Presenilin n=1 Tax=Meloidogyne graminicola TaxID=189291 RepID=A0A8S9ZDT8_9BILA|nr:Presenilin [Meloidogyne graminicola]
MELATIPQNSSAMSTTGTNGSPQHDDGNNQQQKERTEITVKKKRKAAASDSRLSESAQKQQLRSKRRHDSQTSDKMMEEQALKYGASHVIHLFVPVSLCMAVVILTMCTVGYYSEAGEYLPYTPFHGKTTDGAGEILLQSLANAGILLVVIIVMTIILILLYKAKCYKIIHAWLMLSSLMLLSMFTLSFIEELFRNYNIPIDYITLGIFLWNWCVLGMICIHWQGPLILQQFYLVSVSALMALMFIKHLPEWSVWSILAVLSIWDLVAVLCPKGPLRILVETAQKRDEPIFPALIYSSGILYMYTLTGIGQVNNAVDYENDEDEEQNQRERNEQEHASTSTNINKTKRESSSTSIDELLGKSDFEIKGEQSTSSRSRSAPNRPSTSKRQNVTTSDDSTIITIIGGNDNSLQPSTSSRPPRRTRSAQNLGGVNENDLIEERGIKLGLGDFIFYSVLVGKASSYGDWNVTIACYVSILVVRKFIQ